MDHNQLRQTYLQFFLKQGHNLIAPASLVPENDPTTLFTSSGMQQLVPYFKGELHPMGTQLVDSQPSFRAEDIDEVGDNRHTTFFEMLGNWSLGNYFKKEQLSWFYKFLTNELNINKDKLFVTVFAGNEFVPKDQESIEVWQKLFDTHKSAKYGNDGFDSETKIYMYDAHKNWWSRSGPPDKMPAGEIGGPDSEVFYDFGAELQLHENSQYKSSLCHPNCDCGRFLEIGNSVFMQYEKRDDGSFKPLPKQNVDFGGGLERILMAVQNQQDIFETSIFKPIIDAICEITGKRYSDNIAQKPMRIIADHLRAVVFMIYAGVEPSNKQQGYFLRRYLRRAAVKMQFLAGKGSTSHDFKFISDRIIDIYKTAYFDNYPTLRTQVNTIIDSEITKFGKTLEKGLKIVETTALDIIDEGFAFNLFQTYGFPFEITQELLIGRGKSLDRQTFNEKFKQHQDQSRTASKGMFAGGLADHSEIITKLHTATHLLNQSLRQVLDRDDIVQVGSNITAERLRFDFTYPDKLTDQQMQQIENMVNEQITKDLPVSFEVMDKDEALKSGAIGAFAEKYADKVKVYSVQGFSREICGGPHVQRTGVLGKFTIGKQEAVGAGKRRIYGYLISNGDKE